MKTNAFLIRFSILMIVIFGVGFIIRYVQTGDFYVDQIIGVCIGLIILAASLIWKKGKRISEKSF